MRVDYHCHTVWSDGSETIEDTVKMAQKRGLDVIGIADHCGSVLKKGLKKYIQEIRRVNQKYPIKVMAGIEFSLDRNGKILAKSLDGMDELDFCVYSVHLKVNADEYLDIIGKLEIPKILKKNSRILGHPFKDCDKITKEHLDKLSRIADTLCAFIEINTRYFDRRISDYFEKHTPYWTVISSDTHFGFPGAEKTILVTGVGGGVGQALLKSLRLLKKKHKYPIKIIGVDCNPKAAGRLFGFIDKFLVVPKANSPDYINSMIKTCEENFVSLILPGSDDELIPLSKNKKMFKRTKIVVPSLSLLEISNNKRNLYKFCKENKILTPVL